MKAKEYLEKNYGQGHLQSVMQLDDILSIFALMDEFAEYKVKNCNAPDVSVSSEDCKHEQTCGLDPCNLDECPEYEKKTSGASVCQGCGRELDAMDVRVGMCYVCGLII